MRVKKEIRKLAFLQEYIKQGELTGMFIWERDGMTLNVRRVITEEFDVEPIHQYLYFHRGKRKQFEALIERLGCNV